MTITQEHYTRKQMADWIREQDSDAKVSERTITYYGEQGHIAPPVRNRYSHHALCQVRAIRAMTRTGMELAQAAKMIVHLTPDELMAKAEQTLAVKSMTTRLPTPSHDLTLPRSLLYSAPSADSYRSGTPVHSPLDDTAAPMALGATARAGPLNGRNALDDELKVIHIEQGLSLVLDQRYGAFETQLTRILKEELRRLMAESE